MQLGLMNNARDKWVTEDWPHRSDLMRAWCLSFLMLFFFFLKQCLVENIQGKFQKNSSVTLISEESP